VSNTTQDKDCRADWMHAPTTVDDAMSTAIHSEAQSPLRRNDPCTTDLTGQRTWHEEGVKKRGDESKANEASSTPPAKVNGRGSEEKAERPGGKEGKEGGEDPEEWSEKGPRKPGGKGEKKGKIELNDFVNEDEVK